MTSSPVTLILNHEIRYRLSDASITFLDSLVRAESAHNKFCAVLGIESLRSPSMREASEPQFPWPLLASVSPSDRKNHISRLYDCPLWDVHGGPESEAEGGAVMRSETMKSCRIQLISLILAGLNSIQHMRRRSPGAGRRSPIWIWERLS